MLLETSLGRVGVVQIAGLVARRIVSFVREGETIGVGDRFGLIRFGSRVDVYLPDTIRVMVGIGATAIAGETVLADVQGHRGAALLQGRVTSLDETDARARRRDAFSAADAVASRPPTSSISRPKRLDRLMGWDLAYGGVARRRLADPQRPHQGDAQRADRHALRQV